MPDQTRPELRELVEALEPLLDNAGGYDVSVVRGLMRQTTDQRRQEWLDAEERARLAWKALKAALSAPVSVPQEPPEATALVASRAATPAEVQASAARMVEKHRSSLDKLAASRDTPTDQEPSAPADPPKEPICPHQWVMQMITVPTGTGSYDKPGATRCCLCGAFKPSGQVSVSAPPSSDAEPQPLKLISCTCLVATGGRIIPSRNCPVHQAEPRS